MSVLPLPPVREYGPLIEPHRYYRYTWDTMDVPVVQEGHIEGLGPATIFTPSFDNLVVYGREVGSPFEEDQEGLKLLRRRGRVMGEWFSVECPQGELGSMALTDLSEIGVAEFSAAFKRGWADG